MNIVFILCVFFVFLLINSGLSEKTSSGAYYVTSQPLTDKEELSSNKTGTLISCHKHRNRAENFKQHSKSFIPQCYPDGTYAPLQCHPASGYCWCADKLGNEKAGTKSRGVISCGMKFLERPCQRHRSRALIFSGLVTTQRSVFIPRCSKDGYYSPLQCLVRNTQCWCTDKNGKEKQGTRRRGTAYCGDGEVTRRTPDTFSASRRSSSKRPCMRHKNKRDRWAPLVKRILFNPNCDKEGNYAAKQCFAGRCWCSTPNGKIIPGSKRKGDVRCGRDGELTVTPDTFSVTGDKPASKGPCMRHKKAKERFAPLVRRKLFNPNCDKEGYYAAKQCFAKRCWCSTRNGRIVPGSKKKGDVRCGTDSLSGPAERTVCFTRRLESLQMSLFKKSFIPLCKSDGSFTPLQCDVHKGVCWCVDEKGKELVGSRTRRTPNCLSKVPSKRPCNLHIKYVQELPSTDKIHLPVCGDDGFYQPMQCGRNKDYCWCVKKDGTEILGTFTFGKPLCPDNSNRTDVFNANKPTRRGPCLRHKERRKNLLSLFQRDIFDPTCDEDGYYDAKQCYANYCWCADRNGKLLPGSRKKGNVDCDESSVQAMKPCFAKRHKSLKMSLFEKAFIPQCTSDGFYTPLQCDVNSGICWCVNTKGRKIVGSRTKRTPKCFSNTFNTVGEGPCNLLKSHLKNFQTPNKIHEPMCQGNGFFQQSQCSKNKEYCWCVLNDGTEIEGSITFDKPRCREKPFPAVPIVRGPCEEHLFHLNNLQSDREVYVPICSAKGFYAPRQCNNNTGLCWCVDLYGSTILGTRTTGTPICETLKPCLTFKKMPHQIKPGLKDVYNPVCTKDGNFAPLQCNVNNGKCWCVNKMGVETPGTSIYERPYCGKKKRACELERRSYLSKKTNQTVRVAPSCDLHGYYASIQCDHASGECWCSDRYGKEVKGTRIKGMPNCGRIPRPCDEHASRTSNYDYVFGVHIPQCDSDGYYKDIQCHNKTNICWCSNKIGVEISGTKTTGKPNCKF